MLSVWVIQAILNLENRFFSSLIILIIRGIIDNQIF